MFKNTMLLMMYNCFQYLTSLSANNTVVLMCQVTQLCLSLCDPMDCSLPGSFVHGDSLPTVFLTHRLTEAVRVI